MYPDLPPAAEGELGQTPFAHLMVYALDKRITGELFLAEVNEDGADGPCHVMRFEAGVPTKIKVGDTFARLGELLIEGGHVKQDALEGALAIGGGLLGDMLILGGAVESTVVEEALVRQFERRIARFFALSPATRFKYFDKAETLVHWGGEPSRQDPFRLLWLGVQAHGECSTLMGPTLDLLRDAPLAIHPRAPHARFGFDGGALDVVDVLTIEPTPYEEILKLETAPPELVQKVIYALMITKQLDLGKGGLPIGVEDRPATVAKVQLQKTMTRRGAAIDAPAEDRTPIRPITIRRGSQGTFEVIPREEDLAPSSTNSEAEAPSQAPATAAPRSPRRESEAQDAPPSSNPKAEASAGAEERAPRRDSGRIQLTPPPVPEARASRPDSGRIDLKPVPAAPASAPAPASDPGRSSSPPSEARSSSPDLGPKKDTPFRIPSPKGSASKASPPPSSAAPISPPVEKEEPSQQRLIAEAVRGMPLASLIKLALDRLDEKDSKGALEVCKIAREADPNNNDVRAIAIWAASQRPSADLKLFTIELDEAIQEKDSSLARIVRGVLRRRLGEDRGAVADLRRAVELDPTSERAKRELAQLERVTSEAANTGIIKRLFRR
ncbi:MAG: hypothetical protein U0414_34710 [Polyangiaceae bacterium]